MDAAPRRAGEVRRIYAEGLAADVGVANPYYGQRVNATVWRAGYRRMLDEAIANGPAMRAYLQGRQTVRGELER